MILFSYGPEILKILTDQKQLREPPIYSKGGFHNTTEANFIASVLFAYEGFITHDIICMDEKMIGVENLEIDVHRCGWQTYV